MAEIDMKDAGWVVEKSWPGVDESGGTQKATIEAILSCAAFSVTAVHITVSDRSENNTKAIVQINNKRRGVPVELRLSIPSSNSKDPGLNKAAATACIFCTNYNRCDIKGMKSGTYGCTPVPVCIRSKS